MTTRTILLAVAFLFAAACGGGGGGAPPPEGPGPDPDPSDPALAILEDCAPDALGAMDDYVTLFDQLVTGARAGVTIIDASEAPEVVAMEVDLDLDNNPDITVLLRFEDGAGDPASLGWTEMQRSDLVQNGISDLPALLTPLDGVTVVMETDLPGPPQINGEFKVLYTSGAPDTAGGILGVIESPCQTQFTFSGVAYSGLLTTFPTSSVTTSILVSTDTLTGTITMNGTVSATATMALNGGAPAAYTINLMTGEVVAAP